MNFFKTKPRTPPDLVRGLRDAVPRLEASAPGGESRRKVRGGIYEGIKMCSRKRQANEEVSKNLQQIKGILIGDGGT